MRKCKPDYNRYKLRPRYCPTFRTAVRQYDSTFLLNHLKLCDDPTDRMEALLAAKNCLKSIMGMNIATLYPKDPDIDKVYIDAQPQTLHIELRVADDKIISVGVFP